MGLAPADPYKKRPENHITLTFNPGRHITHDRIAEAVEPQPGRWMHHIIIEEEENLNADVQEWLREAYAFRKMR